MDQKNINNPQTESVVNKPTAVPVSPTPKTKSKLPLILGIIILLVVVGTLGVLGEKYLFGQKTETAQPVVTVTTTIPTPTIDPTSDWKTYTNKEYGYLLKYPDTYEVIPQTEKQISQLGKDNNICITTKTDQGTCVLILNPSIGQMPTSFPYTNGSLNNSTIKPLSLNGYLGIRGQETSTIGIGDHVYLQNPKGGYLSIQNSGDTNIFDQILSTFKFLDQTKGSTGPNLKTFTSLTLGISFTYLEKIGNNPETTKTAEVGSKVYVYSSNMQPSQGQWVEVFQKSSNETLDQAIKKQFLVGKSETDCFVKDYTGLKLPNNFIAKIISYPTSSNDDIGTMEQKAQNCAPGYAQTNGISYFLTDINHPNKFLFFSIGQYPISSEGNKLWQDTIQILN